MDNLRVKADKIIKDYAFGSTLTGFIPLPFLDMMSLVGVQRIMIYRLSKLYGVPYSKTLAKSFLASLMSSFTATAASPALGSILKIIPGIGTFAGGVGMAAMGSASTYALGKVFQQHFESGGTLNNFDPEAVKETLQERFEQGKELSKKHHKKRTI